jgi:hypothetical protein
MANDIQLQRDIYLAHMDQFKKTVSQFVASGRYTDEEWHKVKQSLQETIKGVPTLQSYEGSILEPITTLETHTLRPSLPNRSTVQTYVETMLKNIEESVETFQEKIAEEKRILEIPSPAPNPTPQPAPIPKDGKGKEKEKDKKKESSEDTAKKAAEDAKKQSPPSPSSSSTPPSIPVPIVVPPTPPRTPAEIDKITTKIRSMIGDYVQAMIARLTSLKEKLNQGHKEQQVKFSQWRDEFYREPIIEDNQSWIILTQMVKRIRDSSIQSKTEAFSKALLSQYSTDEQTLADALSKLQNISFANLNLALTDDDYNIKLKKEQVESKLLKWLNPNHPIRAVLGQWRTLMNLEKTDYALEYKKIKEEIQLEYLDKKSKQIIALTRPIFDSLQPNAVPLVADPNLLLQSAKQHLDWIKKNLKLLYPYNLDIAQNMAESRVLVLSGSETLNDKTQKFLEENLTKVIDTLADGTEMTWGKSIALFLQMVNFLRLFASLKKPSAGGPILFEYFFPTYIMSTQFSVDLNLTSDQIPGWQASSELGVAQYMKEGSAGTKPLIALLLEKLTEYHKINLKTNKNSIGATQYKLILASCFAVTPLEIQKKGSEFSILTVPYILLQKIGKAIHAVSFWNYQAEIDILRKGYQSSQNLPAFATLLTNKDKQAEVFPAPSQPRADLLPYPIYVNPANAELNRTTSITNIPILVQPPVPMNPVTIQTPLIGEDIMDDWPEDIQPSVQPPAPTSKPTNPVNYDDWSTLW